MAIQLSQEDFERLTDILCEHGEWQTSRGRVDMLSAVFAGSDRQAAIRGQLDLDGAPRGAASHVVHRLATFGQERPGREALGVLINKLLSSLGDGEQAEFLRDLLKRYPFSTRPVATRSLNRWKGREQESDVLEKIIGENTLRDIYTLEVLLQYSRAVVRVRGRSRVGTGFLVAPDLLLTNHHVIGSREMAESSQFEFNYQLDRTRKEVPTQTSLSMKDGLFYTSPLAPENATSDELDYTVVQLADPPSGVTPIPLRPAATRKDDRVSIIQHPGGRYKKISMQNNFVEYADEFIVQYTTSTEAGSSGSPVISDDFEVVALHHAGGQLTEPATKRRYLRNEGIRISAILRDLRDHANELYRRLAE